MTKVTYDYDTEIVMRDNTLKDLIPDCPKSLIPDWHILERMNFPDIVRKAYDAGFRHGRNTPRVGVAACVFKDGKVLLGKRIGKRGYGDGCWQCPGGKIDFSETSQHATLRELEEETSIVGQDPQLVYVETTVVFNNKKQINEHWETLYYHCEYVSGIATVTEPDSCSEWNWFYLHDLPKPLFLMTDKVFEELRSFILRKKI